MMSTWKCVLHLGPQHLRMLVSEPPGADVLKARLTCSARHPRALLTLLEGLALWNGHPLTTVVSAEPSCAGWSTGTVFGDGLWPGESPLVRFESAARGCRSVLRGLGDFRALRSTEPAGLWP
ncbi:MAG: hypothetical protein MUF54_03525 [Polyangiaceae bacterium]|jgi:hypothetical protein|nr:hypothetical protein [Polyangiaceae bacterium]